MQSSSSITQAHHNVIASQRWLGEGATAFQGAETGLPSLFVVNFTFLPFYSFPFFSPFYPSLLLPAKKCPSSPARRSVGAL